LSRRTLNLGILAHVDAGKTTLTERVLYAAGVVDEPGSVKAGTTQTDTLALERQRGITIKAAVVSFAIGDVTVNLIDTPGHPDFVAEVERVLGVLDGAVLVLSAVEGVQAQTRLLMRALQRLRVPTLLFVNKIDRAGASDERTLRAIAERLTPAVVAMGSAHELGSQGAWFRPSGPEDDAFRARLAELLADHDDRLLAAYVEDEDGIPYPRLRRELAAQTCRALVHPVFFGSAITGAGVGPLMAGVGELLPSGEQRADGPLAGAVFKIERAPSGEKVAYVRMFSGTVRVRDLVRFGSDAEQKVTAIAVFDQGTAERRGAVSSGQIGKLWGLREIRIGDRIGEPATREAQRQFAPPTLESVVVPRRADDAARLRDALAQLAEQDPLIAVRQDDRGELSVSLYGEVQKEVIEATLAGDYGLAVEFHETTTIHVERPAGIGEAVEVLHGEGNPFRATIGLRIEPASEGTGLDFRLDIEARTAPLYLYKRLDRFGEAMGGYVRPPLCEGLHGWQVTDCVVTMTRCTYSSPDGPAATRGPLSGVGDFRNLTPIVLMRALEDAGTEVCEPILRARLEVPARTVGAVLPVLARLRAVSQPPSSYGDLASIEAELPIGAVQELRRLLPGLTLGEGALESEFVGYRPVTGPPPTRRRTTPNPLNRAEYLMHLARRA
jgi:ribosomal protection tetracycline resistance protein